jgi:hypothetical protein
VILEVAQTLTNSLIEKSVNQTIAALESKSETEAKAEYTQAIEEAKPAEDIKSTQDAATEGM